MTTTKRKPSTLKTLGMLGKLWLENFIVPTLLAIIFVILLGIAKALALVDINALTAIQQVEFNETDLVAIVMLVVVGTSTLLSFQIAINASRQKLMASKVNGKSE